MLRNRSVKKTVALVLAAAAIVAATVIGTSANGSRSVSATTRTQGHEDAVPPILRAARSPELRAIRRAELQARPAFYYAPATGARYSDAEMKARHGS
jgi:hypothetical protein